MSRRSRGIYIGLCVSLLIVIVWLDHNFGFKPALLLPAEQIKSKDLTKYHNKIFTVTRIIDGDTLEINISDGKFDSTRIRLLGIDTPETKDEKTGIMYFGPEAAQFTEKLALNKNITVLLDSISDTRDKYNRLLAYIKLDDDRIGNEVLIIEGFAYADLRFEHSFYEKYSQLEAIAQQNKKGLWKEVTRSLLPEWLRRMQPKLLEN
jgi:micrococcal nuclease